jgi:hypothetical protein
MEHTCEWGGIEQTSDSKRRARGRRDVGERKKVVDECCHSILSW